MDVELLNKAHKYWQVTYIRFKNNSFVSVKKDSSHSEAVYNERDADPQMLKNKKIIGWRKKKTKKTNNSGLFSLMHKHSTTQAKNVCLHAC